MARAICSVTLVYIFRGTGGGWLPGFRGRVLQLTGMTRFSGVFGLTYQQVSTLPPQYHGFLSGTMTEFDI